MCPVQFRSVCAEPKRMTRSKFVEVATPEMIQGKNSDQISRILPDINNLPGSYCATGRAFCKDLDFSKMCFCKSCQLFKDFSLNGCKPNGYFCREGRAK